LHLDLFEQPERIGSFSSLPGCLDAGALGMAHDD